MKRPIVMTPIEKYFQMQLDINTYVTTHTGTASELVNLFNIASQSYLNALLNKADNTESRPINRVALNVNIGKAINNYTFNTYLSSFVMNPKITFSDLLGNTPSINIYNTTHNTTTHIVDIHIDSISSVSVESMVDTDIEFEQHTIRYHNEANSLDYLMHITMYK